MNIRSHVSRNYPKLWQRLVFLKWRIYYMRLSGVRRMRQMLKLRWPSYRVHIYNSKYEPFYDTVDRLAQESKTLNLPLIILGQPERSGGTLLSQLLDSHSALLMYPNQGQNIYKSSGKLDVGGFDAWMQFMSPPPPLSLKCYQYLDPWINQFARNGYHKLGETAWREKNLAEVTHPFVFSYLLYRQIITRSTACDARDVVSAYYTAFWNAWLNKRALLQNKNYHVVMAPAAMKSARDFEAFRKWYPDGYIIYILRDPVSWFASQRRKRDIQRVPQEMRPYYFDPLFAGKYYNDMLTSHVTESRCTPIVFMDFDALISEPRASVTALLEKLGLDYQSSVDMPTFNMEPVLSNSSYNRVRGCVDKSVLQRNYALRGESNDPDLQIVKKHSWELYKEALKLCIPPAEAN